MISKCYKQESLKKEVCTFFEKEYPLVRLFNYGDDVLLYDAKPHFVCVFSYEELDVLIDFLQKMPDEEISQKHSSNFEATYLRKLLIKYQELHLCGFFLKGPIAEISAIDREIIKKQLQYFDENIVLRKFCLEVTEDCNYRCTYCKNTIATENRKHSQINMTEEMAFKGIDYYFVKYTQLYNELSDEKQKLIRQIAPPSLAWYGGEPFLQFDLVKASTEYFKNLPWNEYGINNSELVFSVNTNLSIINEEILEFLVSNNFILFASLDGPEEEHNRCRIFKNGEGTFKQAYANLLKIKDFNKTYFKKQVSIFGVYTDEHDHQKCSDFINNMGAADVQHFPAEYPGVFMPEIEKEFDKLSQAIDNGLIEFKSTIAALVEKNNTSQNMNYFQNLIKFTGISYEKPFGSNMLMIMLTCPMGFDNLMLGANGNYLICHKTDGSMPIGNYMFGLDFEKMTDLYQNYNMNINVNCKNCWNLRFCKICAASRTVNGDFQNPTRNECDFFRLQTEYDFLCFIHLSLEHGDILQKIFDYWNDDKRRRSSIIDISKF